MQWALIDGNSWFAADWYANQTHCATTFINRLRTLLDQFEFGRVAVCWDSPRSFRKDLMQEYKGHRSDKPREYYDALQAVKQMVAQEGIDSLEVPTFESDDCLATLAQIAVDEGVRAVIISADKDLHQCLVVDQVSQVISWARVPAPGGQFKSRLQLVTVTARSMQQRYGVWPHQWVDYRVIVGDPSDGIIGCKGVGPDAAVKVLQACGELERFYASPFSAAISDSKRNLLIKHRPQVDRLRSLLTLRRDVPVLSRWLEAVA